LGSSPGEKSAPGAPGGYISRVEDGHAVRALETLEKMAEALELPRYQIMYDGRGELTK
jgi:hypothetical protein